MPNGCGRVGSGFQSSKLPQFEGISCHRCGNLHRHLENSMQNRLDEKKREIGNAHTAKSGMRLVAQ
jgi:hypothetical protein